MIPHGVDIFIGLEPIDLRWSFDRLSGLVADRIGREARGGALFVFFGKRHDALKILFFDGTGMCLFYKRLDQGTFRLPTPVAEDAAAEILSLPMDPLMSDDDVDLVVEAVLRLEG